MSLREIIDYEEGHLSEQETISMFAGLIKTGRIFHLQGSYLRTASEMIESGYISPNGTILVNLSDDF